MDIRGSLIFMDNDGVGQVWIWGRWGWPWRFAKPAPTIVGETGLSWGVLGIFGLFVLFGNPEWFRKSG
jgi:hypothetical protein